MEKRNINEIIKYFNNEILNKGIENVVIENISTDSRTVKNKDLFIPLIGDNFDAHDFFKDVIKKNPAAVIIEKAKYEGIKEFLKPNIWVFGVDDTLKAYQEIAKSYLKTIKGIKKIAVTGSSGKTTTKEIIRSILSEKYTTYANKGNFNNRFGVPKTALEITSDIEIAIFEMGMGAPGDIEKLAWIIEPDIACITSISEAHIEFFDSIEEIAKTKKGIFKYFSDDNYAVLNEEENLYSILVYNIKGKLVTFNKNKSKKIKVIDNLGYNGYKLKVNGKDVFFKLGGGHNITNLYFALCIAEILDVSDEQIIKGIEKITLPGMRNQIREGRYTLILDCYNANPSSMKSALKFFNDLPPEKKTQKKIVVLADMLELGKKSEQLHRDVGEFVTTNCFNIDYIFTYGAKAKFIAEQAKLSNFNSKNIYSFMEKNDLKDKLKGVLQKGDIILFKASRGMKLEEIADNLT